MKKNNKLLILSILTSLLIVSFGLLKITSAQSNITAQSNAEAIDAIGVRVLPNPNHYSITRWYQSQGFYGSPQSLVVDGYEAIRDGRTVYVSAANIVGKDVYTNIYLISYNQDPSVTTVDILGQIISRWKFNNNLEDLDLDSQSTCSISSISCSNDAECGQGRFCAQEGLAKNSCQLQETKNCRSDNDCPTNFFCDSDKAKITRDMKRIGRLGEMKDALANYYQVQGKYPLLEAGTYLVNKSVSLWPSWQQVLLSNIAVSPNFIDPINRLGSCPGFDVKTCWNINENRFYSDQIGNTLTLPTGSYAMVYTTDTEGANYNLCATLESRHPSLNYNFVGSDLSESLCVSDIGVDTIGGSENNPPVLVDYNLNGQVSKEFNAYIKVYDADNDPLKWEIFKGQANWGSWSSDAFRIIDTSNKFQKKIFASLAPGTNSSFPITLRVSDSRGGVLEKDLLVEIQDYGVFIEAQNVVHVLDKNVPLLYSFYVSGDNLNNPPNVSLSKVSGNGNIPFQISERILVSESRYRVTFTADLNPESYQFPENTDFEFAVIATDNKGQTFKKNFNLRLISEKPVLQFSCLNKTRAGQNYSCLLGRTDYFGRGFSYEISGAPQNLKIEVDADKAEAYIKGQAQAIVGGSSQLGEHLISVVAKSDYGATTTRSFKLTVNSFCGDGTLQAPNSEGRGGMNNDGYEQCDGMAGTTQNPASSDKDKQYACSTFNSETPLEITSGNYCVFKSSLSGGGYCDDGYCQTRYETKTNCPEDCSDGSSVVSEGCSFNSDCESWQECNLVLGRCVVASGQCETQNDCESGFECNLSTNKCEPKSFINLETTKAIDVRTGDITRDSRITDCSVIRVDNPDCTLFNTTDKYSQFPLCPLACDRNYWLYKTSDGDRCRDQSPYIGSDWWPRNVYRCYNAVNINRRFNEPCRRILGNTSINGVMNAEGKCVISSSFCGNGFCDSGETCDSCSQDCGKCLVNPEDDSDGPDQLELQLFD